MTKTRFILQRPYSKMFDLNADELVAHSEAFQRFYASLQDSDPRDGLQIDLQALKSLNVAEQAEAESLLIAMIEGWGGSVVDALAEIKSRRGAVALKEQLQKRGGEPAAEIALALWRIERWPKAQRVLIDILEGKLPYFPGATDLDDFEAMGRAKAAENLAYIPDEKSVAALTRALSDPDELVRYWAQISLNVIRQTKFPPETDIFTRSQVRRRRRKYDWFGCALWFVFGMFIGGIPLFVHLAFHTANASWRTLVGVMLVCGLIGGLVWGRRHRRNWEAENNADEMFEEVLRSQNDSN